jgi:hypothetical protein
VYHTVGGVRSAAQALEIFERTAMHFGTSGGNGRCCRIRASHTEHLVPGID